MIAILLENTYPKYLERLIRVTLESNVEIANKGVGDYNAAYVLII